MTNLEILPRTFDAYLFDLDDLLVESMPRHERAWNLMMERAGLKIPLDAEVFSSLANMPASAVAEKIARTHDTWIDLEHFLYEEAPLFSELKSDAELVRTVAGLIRELAAHSRVAIVSGGGRELLSRSLATTGLGTVFRLAVTRDEVGRGKPSPDIFLLAAGILRTVPARCLVVHDSEAAESIIRAASMQPFRLSAAVPSA